MNKYRREFLLNTFRFGGKVACAVVGFSLADILWAEAKVQYKPGGVIPSPGGVDAGAVGELTHGSNRNLSNGYLYGSPIACGDGGQVSYAHIWINTATNASLCINLMNSDGSTIHAYASQTGVAESTGQWYNWALNTPYTIVLSTTYYCSVIATDSGTLGIGQETTSTGDTNYEDQSGYHCPANAVVGWTDLNTKNMTIYFDNQSGDPA